MQAAEVLDLIALSLIRFSFMFKHLLDAFQWRRVWPSVYLLEHTHFRRKNISFEN